MKKNPLDPGHRTRQKMIRKMLAAGLPLVVLIGCLSGCGKKAEVSKPQPSSAVTKKEPVQQQQVEVQQPEIKEEPSSPAPGTVHLVKKGDTLSSIAKQYGTTVAKLQKLNGMTESQANRLKIGQEIKIK